MTVRAAHARFVVHVGRHAFDGAPVGESQAGVIDLREPGKTQRDPTGAGVTTETLCVGDVRRQSRVRVLGMLADVTGEATPAAATRNVDDVLRFRLAEVTARTLLAQHRIRDRVAEGLKVL